MSLPVYINLNCPATRQNHPYHKPPVANFLDIYLRIFASTKKNGTLRVVMRVQICIQHQFHAHKNRTKNINKNQRPFKSDRRIGGPYREKFESCFFFYFYINCGLSGNSLCAVFLQHNILYTFTVYTYIILIFQLFNLNLQKYILRYRPGCYIYSY